MRRGWLAPKSEVRLGVWKVPGLSPKGGNDSSKGGRVLARGTRFCT